MLPVESHVDPGATAPVQPGQRVEVHLLTRERRVRERLDPRRVREQMGLVVDRCLECHRRRQCLSRSELEQSGLREPDVAPKQLAGVCEAQVVVRMGEEHAEGKRVHLLAHGNADARSWCRRIRDAQPRRHRLVRDAWREHRIDRGDGARRIRIRSYRIGQGGNS